ncbi:MAG: NAD-dependent epimerase/dehydratase family protein [Alphaproteobacteria bacterium]
MASLEQSSRRYLVTGGCGFIGSHLVDALITQGHDVVILDDLSTGRTENKNPRAELIIGDTADYATVERALGGTDGCFHLAAVASVEKSVVEWVHTHTVNVTSTVNIFQAVSRMQKRIPVVYTSSAAVYGDCAETPIKENTDKQPLTAYGVDKYACDLHGRVAWHVHGIPTMGVRPFNIYGPRQDPASPYSGVISIFVDRMRSKQPVTIFGDGGQTRDFVFVADAVKVFVAAMTKIESASGEFDIVNICRSVPTSVRDLADTVARLTGYDLPYNYEPPRKGDIRTSVGDSSHLHKTLGLTLGVTLPEGLEAMLGTR